MEDSVFRPPQASIEPTGGGGGGFGAFNLSRAFDIGWKVFEKNIGPSVTLGLVYFLAYLGATFAAILCVGLFLIPPIAAAYSVIGLRMVRGTVRTADVGVGFKAYGPVFVATLLIGLAVLAVYLPGYAPGLGLMIADMVKNEGQPGAGYFLGLTLATFGSLVVMPVLYYLFARWMLAYPLIVERNYGAVQALRASWNATREAGWKLALYMFLVYMISSSGIILCGIGIIFSFPLSMSFLGAALYQLLGEDQGGDPPGVAPWKMS